MVSEIGMIIAKIILWIGTAVAIWAGLVIIYYSIKMRNLNKRISQNAPNKKCKEGKSK